MLVEGKSLQARFVDLQQVDKPIRLSRSKLLIELFKLAFVIDILKSPNKTEFSFIELEKSWQDIICKEINLKIQIILFQSFA